MRPSFSRRFVYPAVFNLRRESVFRYAAEMAKEQFLGPAEVEDRQLALLRPLVAGAIRDHAVYRELAEGNGFSMDRGAGLETLSDLKKLPILEKDDLRRIHTDLLAGPGSLARHTVRKTGGSSGEPCIILADRTASARSLAARIVCQGWYGIRVGDRQLRLWGRPLAGGYWQSRAKDLILNRIRLDSLALAADRIDETLRRIKRFKCDFCYGYTSLIQLLADNVATLGAAEVFDGMKAVVSTSETLPAGQQEKLADMFGCAVANEYGCSEVDIISFSCPAGGEHIIASNMIVEVIRFGDEPEGYGQVVVTDLHNGLMPVIRYRVGDLAPLDPDPCDCGRGWPCLGRVLGRAQGQYIVLPDGRQVHSQFVVYMLEELAAEGVPLGRFKVIQETADSLKILIAGTGAIDTRRVLEYCQNQGQDVLDGQMKLEICRVDPAVLEESRVNKYQHFETRL